MCYNTIGLVEGRGFAPPTARMESHRWHYAPPTGLVALAGFEPAWAVCATPSVPGRLRIPFRHSATSRSEGGDKSLTYFPTLTYFKPLCDCSQYCCLQLRSKSVCVVPYAASFFNKVLGAETKFGSLALEASHNPRKGPLMTKPNLSFRDDILIPLLLLLAIAGIALLVGAMA